MKKYDHPENPELPSAARNALKKNPFRQILHRRRFDRAENAFHDLADRTACRLIDLLADRQERNSLHPGGSERTGTANVVPLSGPADRRCSERLADSGTRQVRELAAALSRLNDLLAALESYADAGCMSFCIRRYDRLHTVADTANE